MQQFENSPKLRHPNDKAVEAGIAKKFVTKDRVSRQFANIVTENGGMWQKSMIPELLERVERDVLIEHGWDIAKISNYGTVDFGLLKFYIINEIKTVRKDIFK